MGELTQYLVLYSWAIFIVTVATGFWLHDFLRGKDRGNKDG